MGQQIESALSQSMHRLLVMLVQLLPGVLALLLAVVVFTAIGFALAAGLRRFLTAIHFDERVVSGERAGSPANFSDWAHSPTVLIARGALWACVFAGVALGISSLDAFYGTSQFSRFLLPYVTHLTGAILLLLVGSLVARFLSRSVLIGAVNAQLQYARFLSLGVKWLVLVLTAAMAIDHLQIGGAIVELAFGILFGGIVLTLSLAIGLGSRDLVARSIEKSIEKPPVRPVESTPLAEAESTRAKLRHF